MNLWHTIVIKIGHAIAAIVLLVGLAQPPAPPQTTTIEVPTGQISTGAHVDNPAPSPKKQRSKLTPPLASIPDVEPDTPPIVDSPPQSVAPPVIIINPPVLNILPDPTPPVQTAPLTQQPKSMKTLEVISPIGGKGLGREYLSRAEVKDEANYIELGLIVRDDEGNVVNDTKVEVSATDSDQNKTMNGTGNITKIYPDGNKTIVAYYPFHYEFKTAGKHKITFTSEGITQEVTLSVAEDTRP